MLLADAISANQLAVEQASIPELRRLLPLLREAQGQLGVELGRWFKATDPALTYERHRHQALMVQLQDAIASAEGRLGTALAEDIDHEAHHARQVAISNLTNMVEAGQQQFEGAIQPMRIDVASILADEQQLLIGRMKLKGAQYATDVVEDIGNKLAIGMVRGETVDQLASRLLGSTGMIRVYKQRGGSAMGEAASEVMFRKYQNWAKSIARTELVNAYAESQARSIREMNTSDPGWSMRWDAANDWRVCKWCFSLDGETIAPDQSFRAVGKFGARPHPPLHTCCRCSLVPWRSEWQEFNQQQRGARKTDEDSQ